MKKILSIILFFTTIISYATEEVYTVRENSSSFSSGFDLLIEDGRYTELAGPSFSDNSVDLYIKFGVDERESYGYIGNFSAQLTANVTIYPIDNGGTELTAQAYSQALTIDYTSDGSTNIPEIQTSIIKHSGFHKYRIHVDQITNAPQNIYIEAELHIDRYYEISQAAPQIGVNQIYYTPQEVKAAMNNGQVIPSNAQEIEIWWDYVEGAEEYELEWTWIDNYSENGLNNSLSPGQLAFNERDFELNNTRVITNNQSYKVPLIYAEGYLIYRVRGVGRWIDNNFEDVDKVKFGAWTTEGITPTTVASWPNFVQVGTGHESRMNWQFQAVYAEEGKKKEIVSYFDGSLRNRQTVTKINSNNEAIVGENIYDNQGRSAIQILPTPVSNPALKFYQSLNLNLLGQPYSHLDFDWDDENSNACISPATGMSVQSGASQYYSSNNTIENTWQDQVPDAEAFPFVQVEYTPDNTGRIRSQSGVGSTYTIDGDHATKYFYLQPHQEDLDRLFGYQVGYKSRYKKNLVVDANGQVSVSYIDPQGRVIATALAGDNGTNLNSLSQEIGGNHVQQSVDLLNKQGGNHSDTGLDDNEAYSSGNNGPLNDGLLLNTQEGSVNDNSQYDFTYRIRTTSFSDDCMPVGISYPFAYSLNIDVRDDCGESVLFGGTQTDNNTSQTTPINTGAITQNINTANVDNTFEFQGVLDVGSYTVSKRLEIDHEQLELYVQQYLEDNTCLYPLDSFFVDNTDCFDELPGQQLEITNCLVYREMMLADVSPMGQYGGTDGSDLLSVFSPVNVLAQGNLGTSNTNNWRNPTIPYEDQYEAQSYIEIEPDLANPGQYIPAIQSSAVPQTINGNLVVLPQELALLSDFIAVWESSWAKSLVAYHPEFSYELSTGQICTMTYSVNGDDISSDSYDATLQTITSYSDAITPGSNSLGLNLVNVSTPISNSIYVNDPYFNIDYPFMDFDNGTNDDESGFRSDLMEAIMSDYKGFGITMWQFAVQSVVCGTNLSGNCTLTPAQLGGDLSTLTTAQQDHVWNIYKQTYLAEKKKINQIFLDCYAIRQNVYNGYIGQEVPTTPSLTGFLYYQTFMNNGFTNVLFGNDTYALSLLELYYEAIIAGAANTSNVNDQFPWSGPSFAVLFAEKQKRFIPIDNLYDSTVPEDVMIATTSEEVDAQQYAQTGRCDLSFDVEYFLDALAQNTLLQTPSTSSNTIPQFTADLYTAMGGTVSTSGAPVNIASTNVSGGLSITSNDATGSNTNMHSINLDPVAFNWSNVVGMNTLYYIPGSYAANGVYEFKILALVDNGTTIDEHVITGSTQVQIGECSYAPICERADNFGDNLGAVFTQLNANGDFINPLNNVLLTSVTGAWYEASELETQLGDYTNTATITTQNNGSFTINSGVKSIGFTNTVPLSNIYQINGFVFDQTSMVLTMYYIDNAGLSQNSTISINYLDNGLTGQLDLSCGCEAEIDLAIKIEAMLNDGIISYIDPLIGNTNSLPNGYTSTYLTALDGYVDFTIANSSGHLELHNFLINTTSLDFRLGKIDCPNSLVPVDGTTNISTLVAVHNVAVTSAISGSVSSITALGELANGTLVPLTSNRTCFIINPCNDCIPLTVEPVSCDDKYTLYNNEITSLNTNLSELDQFTVYTQEEFCGTYLAYVVDAYLYYLSEFGITNNNDDKYLSLVQFGNTQLNYGFNDVYNNITLSNIVDEYQDVYLVVNPTSELSWNDYVNQVYIPAHPESCPPAPMPTPVDITIDYPCEQLTANIDTVNAQNQYDIYLANTIANFKQRYIEEGMSSVVENFEETYQDKEYHYTLYYYDQAGNLVQTVPPAGVDRIEQSINESSVDAARNTNATPPNATSGVPDVLPEHGYQTNYKYNSLNQLVWQSTPDGGESYFGYDNLGRLVVSQNAKQLAENQMSYTKYDGIGRIIEVGEMSIPSATYMFNQNGRLVNGGNLVDVGDVNFPDNISTTREEVTVTIYDELIGANATDFESYSEDNTRNRITGVMYFETYSTSGTYSNYDNATFYDYDVHGNVKELIQDIKDSDLQLAGVSSGELKKKTKYDYDLVSGNVKEVAYQNGEDDQFVHQYCYDSDNRITNVFTSKDRVNWEQDAKYFYYDHGPLARTEIGDKKVQSLDYAYTIQGWLKGVNSQSLESSADQGRDALSSHTNQMNGKDVMGYSLHYFDDDYTNRSGNNEFLAYSNVSSVPSNPLNLYNGNIKEMFTASTNTNEEFIGTSHTSYSYDQLNRIKTMEQQIISGFAPILASTTTLAKANYTYDANGNLTYLNRWASNSTQTANQQIDQFEYVYTAGTNQLEYVSDPIGAVVGDDLADQVPYLNEPGYGNPGVNYSYDEIGQLVQDKQEEIFSIDWKVTGKVKRINRATGSTKSNLEFTYDAMGNRIIKAVYTNDAIPVLESKTYYVRDAQGNVMSVYTLNYKDENVGVVVQNENNLYLSERNIYGSSRVGMENVGQIIASSASVNININKENQGNANLFNNWIGDKTYELSNHLGNVLEVITDRKLEIETALNSEILAYYSPDVISQNDYYPFGMLLPNRHDPGDGYRYGFNGMEKIDEVDGVEGSKLDFGNRIYDTRIGRWLSLDGLASEYPHQSDYVYVSNSPIGKIDIDGDWDIEVHAYKNRKKYGYAILIVKDRMGNEVYRTTVRVQGNTSKIGKSRALKMGDTPTGTYNLVEWRATGNDRYSRAMYGPNDLLATDYKSGEGKAAGRNGMHIHGGRQEGDDYMKYGKLLWNTSGCMRIKDSELKEIQNITQRLEENDSQESPGILTVTNDLVDENGKYVIPGDNAGILQNVEPVNSTPKTAVDNTDETIDATLKKLDEMDGVIRDGLENIENMQNEIREMMQEADEILEDNNTEDSAPKKKKIKQAVVIDGSAPKKKKIKQAVVIDGSSGN